MQAKPHVHLVTALRGHYQIPRLGRLDGRLEETVAGHPSRGDPKRTGMIHCKNGQTIPSIQCNPGAETSIGVRCTL
jgi:hypothetical protein